MKPDAFERLAQRVLRESGFVKVEVTGRSGDGGIDGNGILRVGLLSFQVYFQCKRYKGSVPPKGVRDFRGAMHGRTDKGLFITTGTLTAEAKKEAAREPALDGIDGEALCDLLKNLKLGVTARLVETGYLGSGMVRKDLTPAATHPLFRARAARDVHNLPGSHGLDGSQHRRE